MTIGEKIFDVSRDFRMAHIIHIVEIRAAENLIGDVVFLFHCRQCHTTRMIYIRRTNNNKRIPSNEVCPHGR